MNALSGLALEPRETIKPEPISPVAVRAFRAAHIEFRGDARWYQTVLNARIVHDNGTLCFMTYDDEHHRVALVNVAGLQKPPAR